MLRPDCTAKLLRNEEKRQALSGDSPLYTAQLAVALAAGDGMATHSESQTKLETISRKRYVSPYGLPQIYAAANKKEDTSNGCKPRMKITPFWMGYLAPSTRFLTAIARMSALRDLLRRVGLPLKEK